jgi:hypothetical protein
MRVSFIRVVPAALAAGLFAALAPAATAQTIFTDSFNSEGNSTNYTSFLNWTVNRGSVDVLNFYPGSGQGVDMDGSTGAAALLVTKNAFNLAAGNYTLSFDLGKNGSALESMTVRVGSVFTQLLSDSLAYQTQVPTSFSFNVASATTGTISFDHAGGDNQGYTIDNVSLVRNVVQTAAPEPGSLALLLPLMGGMGMGMRRRRK